MSSVEFTCVICRDVIEHGFTLPCEHTYDRECLRGWLSSLQQSGRPYTCVIDGCGREVPGDILASLGYRVVDINQISCPVRGHDHLTEYNRGPPPRFGNFTRCSLDPNATFCASCRISPYHYETISCDQAETSRKAWNKLRIGINLYNAKYFPGPRPFYAGFRSDAISCPPPQDYSSLRIVRDYIVQNRSPALQRIREAPPNDILREITLILEGPALPRSRPSLLTLVDLIDQALNDDPRNIVAGGMYGGILSSDEAWKVENCRLCPKCGRIINRTIGCDQMICGRDFHGSGVVGGCGKLFRWTDAAPYVSDEVAPEDSIKILYEDDTPLPSTIVMIGSYGYRRECHVCKGTRKNMYLCTSLEPAVIFCFHCLSSSYGSIEVLRKAKERASQLSGTPIENVLLPVDHNYVWISI